MAANDADAGGKKYRTIILGAGISGLSAAKHLVKNNMLDFLILEAKGNIGGRICAIEKGTLPGTIQFTIFRQYTANYNVLWVYSNFYFQSTRNLKLELIGFTGCWETRCMKSQWLMA